MSLWNIYKRLNFTCYWRTSKISPANGKCSFCLVFCLFRNILHKLLCTLCFFLYIYFWNLVGRGEGARVWMAILITFTTEVTLHIFLHNLDLLARLTLWFHQGLGNLNWAFWNLVLLYLFELKSLSPYPMRRSIVLLREEWLVIAKLTGL
jgi:hypothetical protein